MLGFSLIFFFFLEYNLLGYCIIFQVPCFHCLRKGVPKLHVVADQTKLPSVSNGTTSMPILQPLKWLRKLAAGWVRILELCSWVPWIKPLQPQLSLSSVFHCGVNLTKTLQRATEWFSVVFLEIISYILQYTHFERKHPCIILSLRSLHFF